MKVNSLYFHNNTIYYFWYYLWLIWGQSKIESQQNRDLLQFKNRLYFTLNINFSILFDIKSNQNSKCYENKVWNINHKEEIILLRHTIILSFFTLRRSSFILVKASHLVLLTVFWTEITPKSRLWNNWENIYWTFCNYTCLMTIKTNLR